MKDGDTYTGIALQLSETELSVWTRLPATTLDFKQMPHGNTKQFYCIRFLGTGSDGRVALACSRGGRIVVLKFYFARSVNGSGQPKPISIASAAKLIWHKVYEGVPALTNRVRVVKLCDPLKSELEVVDVLAMPYLHPVNVDRRRDSSMLKKVKTCLERFHAKGYVHGDVAWRNIGTYKDSQGVSQVVVFDMGNVKATPETSKSWIDKAIKDLQVNA